MYLVFERMNHLAIKINVLDPLDGFKKKQKNTVFQLFFMRTELGKPLTWTSRPQHLNSAN